MPSILDSRCILVIGATSGIGRALALALNELSTNPTVIVSGRRQSRLDELAEQTGPGSKKLETLQADINSDRATLQAFVKDVLAKYPDLDTVIFSAGIQHQLDFTEGEINLDAFDAEINTNYIAIVTLISLFLPHMRKLSNEQNRPCFVVPITSGLAIVAAARMPNYCATKAALHSFSMSLSAQLQNTNVHCLEIMPPLVESELHDHQGTTGRLSKLWMPLDEFTSLTMDGLKKGATQIPIGRSVGQYEKYEKGKVEAVNASWK